jgi:hypothetical protein
VASKKREDSEMTESNLTESNLTDGDENVYREWYDEENCETAEEKGEKLRNEEEK